MDQAGGECIAGADRVGHFDADAVMQISLRLYRASRSRAEDSSSS